MRSWIRLAGLLLGLGGLASLQLPWPFLRPDELLRRELFGVSTTWGLSTVAWGVLLLVLAPPLESLLAYLGTRGLLGVVLGAHLALCALAMDAGLLTFARLVRAQWHLAPAQRGDAWTRYQGLEPDDLRRVRGLLPEGAAALVRVDREPDSALMASLLHLHLQPIRLYRHPGAPEGEWLASRGIRWRIDITAGRPQVVPLP